MGALSLDEYTRNMARVESTKASGDFEEEMTVIDIPKREFFVLVLYRCGLVRAFLRMFFG